MVDVNKIINSYPHSEEIDKFPFKLLSPIVDKFNKAGVVVSNAFNVFMKNATDICSNNVILATLKNSGVYDTLTVSIATYCRERSNEGASSFKYGLSDLFAETILMGDGIHVNENVLTGLASFIVAICNLAYKLPEKSNADCISAYVMKHAIYDLKKNAVLPDESIESIEEHLDMLGRPEKGSIMDDESLALLSEILLIFLNRMCWSFMCQYLVKNNDM